MNKPIQYIHISNHNDKRRPLTNMVQWGGIKTM